MRAVWYSSTRGGGSRNNKPSCSNCGKEHPVFAKECLSARQARKQAKERYADRPVTYAEVGGRQSTAPSVGLGTFEFRNGGTTQNGHKRQRRGSATNNSSLASTEGGVRFGRPGAPTGMEIASRSCSQIQDFFPAAQNIQEGVVPNSQTEAPVGANVTMADADTTSL